MSAPRISSAKAAARYIERGWAPVPIPARQKGPQIPGWQRLRMSVSDVPRYFIGGQNIGIITGKASGWLVTVDLEECCILCSDAMAFAKNLYIAYKEWCEANREPVEKQRRFGIRLTERGLRRQKVGGVYRWYGIRHDGPGPSEVKDPADENASFAGNSSAQTSDPGPSGPDNQMNTRKKGLRENNGEIGPDNAGEDPLSSDLEPGWSATPEQLRKIRKLVREGMVEGLAREEILGKGWVEP